MKIRSPRELFGNVKFTHIHPDPYLLVVVYFKKKINLEEFAKKLPECVYDDNFGHFVKIKNKFGCIMVYPNHFKIQHLTDLNKADLLCSFVHEVLRAEGDITFEQYLRSLDRGDLGGFLKSWLEQDVRPVYDDITKPLKKLRR